MTSHKIACLHDEHFHDFLFFGVLTFVTEKAPEYLHNPGKQSMNSFPIYIQSSKSQWHAIYRPRIPTTLLYINPMAQPRTPPVRAP